MLPGEVSPQIVYMPLIGGHEQVAVGLVSGRIAGSLFESIQERNRIERHLDIDVGGELRAHAAHALAGGSQAFPCFALDHQHVLHAGFGEMESDAGTDAPPANTTDVAPVTPHSFIL